MEVIREKVISAVENGPYATRRGVSKVVHYSEPISSEEIEFFIYNEDIKQNITTILVDAIIRSAKNIDKYNKSELIYDLKGYVFRERPSEYFGVSFDRLVGKRIGLGFSEVGEIEKVWELADEPCFTILFAKSNRGYLWFKYQCTA